MDNKQEWTTVQNLASLKYYQHEVLSPPVLEVFDQAFNGLPKSRKKLQHLLLKLFECYLQITDQRLTNILGLSHPQFTDVAYTFCGALYSKRFCNISMERRSKFTGCFLKLLCVLKSKVPELEVRKFKLHCYYANSEVLEAVEHFEAKVLNEERVYYWRSWWAQNKKGELRCIPLNSIYRTYGRRFTDRLFRAAESYIIGSANGTIHCFHQFCEWLANSEYREQDFEVPESTLHIFQQFCWHYISEGHSSGHPINYLSQYFRYFIQFAESHLIDVIFAEPLGRLPYPDTPRPIGSEVRIRKNNTGVEVKEKLLTDIPLNTSDDTAIELLFNEIHSDIRHVITVAQKDASCLWRRYLRRQRLAKLGAVRHPGSKNQSGIRNGQRWLVNHNNPDRLSNICATFQRYGFTLNTVNEKRICYGSPARDSAFQLGLPTSYALIPLFALLVYEHPNITAGMIKDFVLYDKFGHQSGFVRLDGGWVLDMRKDRRGPKNSQMVISLTPKAAAYVRRAIKITDCIRKHLKGKHDDRWRHLWLSSGSSFSPTRMRDYTLAKKSTTANFYHTLRQGTENISTERAKALCERFGLGTLRASRAIQIYLQTRDVKKMASALGHKQYTHNLLSHYLPAPILDFFQSRWVRIFQQGIIIEALKESPHLLEATDFHTMDELHTFLENHTLELPAAPTDDESPGGSPASTHSSDHDEIVFGLSANLLAILMSLHAAVQSSKKTVCAKAQYWSELTASLVAHIEQRIHREDINAMLSQARAQVNVCLVEHLIYG